MHSVDLEPEVDRLRLQPEQAAAGRSCVPGAQPAPLGPRVLEVPDDGLQWFKDTPGGFTKTKKRGPKDS